MNKGVIVFDLDDTLYKEEDFVISAFEVICEFILKRYHIDIEFLIEDLINSKNYNLYDAIIERTKLSSTEFTLEKYLTLYRFHYPKLMFDQLNLNLLNNLKNDYYLSIITDGRSITQRNKIRSLGINRIIDDLIISEETGFEKPHPHNFKIIEKKYSDCNQLYYIGDNTSKDFNYCLGNTKLWSPICLLDNGRNIHKQDLKGFKNSELLIINELTEILTFL